MSVSQLQGDNNFEDQISQLPDEILISILSRLPIKEAGRSSVLSGRWRSLWKLTTCLNFDKSGVLDFQSSSYRNELDLWRSKYVTWVNEVVRSHKCPHLDEFRIHFDLDAKSSSHIDEWMKFMIQKRAKRIEIHLTPYSSRDQYSPSLECYQHIKSPSNLSNVTCLRSLTLIRVNVDGEFVEYLLSKCPHLETLSISRSQHLRRLEVAGPSLPLKYLKTHRCVSLECIVLSAPNLETFEYSGNRVEFIIGNHPLLSELHLLEGRCHRDGLWPVTSSLRLFSSCFSRLETLSLIMALEYGLDMPQAGELRSLKHLVLEIHYMHDSWHLDFSRFLVAAPSLVKLKLQFARSAEMDKVIEDHVIQPHECLKEVEIRWCSGGHSGGWLHFHFEFAVYLAKTSVNLEKMVLDMGSPVLTFMDEEMKNRMIQYEVERLRETLPRRAKLTVVGSGFNYVCS